MAVSFIDVADVFHRMTGWVSVVFFMQSVGIEFARLVVWLLYAGIICSTVWVYRDAKRLDRNALAWALITFVAGPLCVVVALIYVMTGPPREEWRRALE